jgi:hypothetical protein
MDAFLNPRRRAAFQWTARRLLLAGAVFITPYALLALKLQFEDSHGGGPEGGGVLIRFAVVGLFACLMTKWCVDWMKRR